MVWLRRYAWGLRDRIVGWDERNRLLSRFLSVFGRGKGKEPDRNRCDGDVVVNHGGQR